MSEATIDDLFAGSSGADSGYGAPPRRSLPVRVLIVLGIAGLLCVPVFVLLMMVQQTVPVPLLYAACLAVVIASRLIRKVRPPAIRQAGRHQASTDAAWPDGVLLAISRWETQLTWSFTDVARYNRRMQPRLVDLVDERLRQRHSITMAGDPHRARQLLGEPLWTFLTGPVKRAPQPRDLDLLVEALEKL
jgi:hypothetical protein